MTVPFMVMLSGAKHLRDSSGLSSLRMTKKKECHRLNERLASEISDLLYCYKNLKIAYPSLRSGAMTVLKWSNDDLIQIVRF